MKKIILAFFIAAISLASFAQQADYVEDYPKVFIGLGTGINAPTALIGVNIEGVVSENVSLYGAAGIGSWGTKLTGGLQFYKDAPRRFGWYATYSVALGGEGIEVQLETVQNGSEMVKIDLQKASAINVGFNYYWMFRGKNRFNLGAGYSIPLSSRPYKLTDPALSLSETSEAVMTVMQPGGLAITIGVTFGVD